MITSETLRWLLVTVRVSTQIVPNPTHSCFGCWLSSISHVVNQPCKPYRYQHTPTPSFQQLWAHWLEWGHFSVVIWQKLPSLIYCNAFTKRPDLYVCYVPHQSFDDLLPSGYERSSMGIFLRITTQIHGSNERGWKYTSQYKQVRVCDTIEIVFGGLSCTTQSLFSFRCDAMPINRE